MKNIVKFWYFFLGQHNLCSTCLPHMRKTSNQSTYIECPICREKFSRDLHDIPRSLVIVQLIDARHGTSHSSNTSSSSFTAPSNSHQAPPYYQNPVNRYDDGKFYSNQQHQQQPVYPPYYHPAPAEPIYNSPPPAPAPAQIRPSQPQSNQNNQP